MDAFERIVRVWDESSSIVVETREASQESNDYKEEESNSIYQVVLRLKPLDTSQVDDSIAADFISIQGNSLTTSFADKKNDKIETRYDFARVFKPSTTQAQFFLNVIVPGLRDYFQEKDVLVFSYGASNSGKSFTVQGTPTNPGIIPRLLRSIFASIADNLVDHYSVVPTSSKAPEYVNKTEERHMLQEKRKILCSLVKDAPESLDSTLSGMTSAEINDVLLDVPSIPIIFPEKLKYSIWVTFFEIYNEQIFDLLVDVTKKRRTPLKLVFDKNDDCYSPGQLKQYPANSWEEAFDLYRLGKRNLHVSSTLLNRKSSRSHSVFTVKLLALPDNDNETYYFVRHFHVCDLAGTERMIHLNEEKTSVTEMKYINKSLLTLNKCFLNLKKRSDSKTVLSGSQFRESKLTMVFKKFLMGRGRTIMIANVSQDPNLFHQTQLVLQMTAMAHEVIAQQHAVRRRFSTVYGLQSAVARSATPNNSDDVFKELAEVKIENANLKREQLETANEFSILRDEINRLTRENGELTNQNIQLMRRKAVELEAVDAELCHTSLLLDTAKANYERFSKYAAQLEQQLMKTRREKRENETNLESRLSTIKYEHELLFNDLKEHFNVRACEPKAIVDGVLRVRNDMLESAKEELSDQQILIDDLRNIIEDLQQRLLIYEHKDQFETANELKAASDDSLEEYPLDDDSPLYIPPSIQKSVAKSKKKKKQTGNVDIPSTVYTAPGTSNDTKSHPKGRRKLLSGFDDNLEVSRSESSFFQSEEVSPGSSVMRALRPRK